MSTKVEFKAGMTCEGCSGAVTRILKKVEGVQDIQCDIEGKKVVVTGTNLDADLMLQKLKAWGDAAGKEVALEGKE
uniref:HMA domain-containing protein n=1 Tax=Chromera velia CCMP2878 TaxID=1169474 RepID=A0A0G4I6W7_9ALVE|eukprot:Cvel_36387.t1-p1 / transcript=Cvel_36387.t1 / gene=Cvel_36387 / organism=Chromera_velia_CCMP2878 / gene_product=Copper transport protein ATX1, putative / transcript_product=Copper transport protein ATX1, putative / location=Cvel_scaffold7203:1165-1389(+) / protein_length=75 / sequence_SO=supercontig / SO=protein_coding / is_pseudo=false